MRAELAIDSRDGVGEAPVWDEAEDRLIWVDHLAGVVHDAVADGTGWRERNRWTLDGLIAAAVPREEPGLTLVRESTVALLAEGADAALEFTDLGIDLSRVRTNDARCDRRGRLWITTMALDFETPAGGVLRVDPDGVVTEVMHGLVLGNGLDWSPDGGTLYVADSMRMTVEAVELDDADRVRTRRELIRFDAASGAPNGIAVDAAGTLWIALTGGGVVRAFAPDGRPRGEIRIGTPGATSCAFGGSDGETLFITSRSGRMPDAARRLGLDDAMMDNPSPVAGGVFTCRPGARGRPAARFAG